MFKVWFCIPSIRPDGGTVAKWKEMGYGVALLRQGPPVDAADFEIPTDKYLGWAPSTNILAHAVLDHDPEAMWIVGGGDDYLPDPTHDPYDVADELEKHFGGTYGVMQPTGDRWGEDDQANRSLYPTCPALIDRICGSPWMGREWCLRTYMGNGPMYDGYHHMFADEELQCVAKRLDAFLQRRDIVQHHDHWQRGDPKPTPSFLAPVNSDAHWKESRSRFRSRRAAGFPGHEPLPRSVFEPSVLRLEAV